jgi:glycosyltransferase involved in cell wall biosynthesis
MTKGLKTLHISTCDASGGAARASYRLHRALLKHGVDSRMRVIQKQTDDVRVASGVPHRGLLSRTFEKFKQVRWKHALKEWHTDIPVLHSFGYTGVGLLDELNASDADVLNLHWTAEMLSITDIGRLRKPLVWTMHDMWPFCGAEHYASDDALARFRQGYNAINRPRSERGQDLNRIAWESKRKAWLRQRFTLVSPSHWLADCARQSFLFADMAVHVIPNPLDTETLWRPVPGAAARIALGLPMDQKLVLMSAQGGVADPRKGGAMLHETMVRVKSLYHGGIEILVCGQACPEQESTWPCPVHWLGKVTDDRLLVLINAAADVAVIPSLQDNLPNTAVEAQACGIPVAAFAVGGLRDIVTHRLTGWLAADCDPALLAEGIVWLLKDPVRRAAVSAAARQQAVERFSEQVVARQYADLYRQVLYEAGGSAVK